MNVDLDQVLPSYEESEVDDPDVFEVWPEHWDATRIFQACNDKWVVLVGMGGAHYQGLDFAQVGEVVLWLGIEKSEPLFWQLQVMASEAREILNTRTD